MNKKPFSLVQLTLLIVFALFIAYILSILTEKTQQSQLEDISKQWEEEANDYKLELSEECPLGRELTAIYNELSNSPSGYHLLVMQWWELGGMETQNYVKNFPNIATTKERGTLLYDGIEYPQYRLLDFETLTETKNIPYENDLYLTVTRVTGNKTIWKCVA